MKLTRLWFLVSLTALAEWPVALEALTVSHQPAGTARAGQAVVTTDVLVHQVRESFTGVAR